MESPRSGEEEVGSMKWEVHGVEGIMEGRSQYIECKSRWKGEVDGEEESMEVRGGWKGGSEEE